MADPTSTNVITGADLPTSLSETPLGTRVEGLPDPIVKNSMIDVIERPGMGVDLIPEAAERYLAEEDRDFFR